MRAWPALWGIVWLALLSPAEALPRGGSGGWPTVHTVTHANGSKSTFSTLSASCSSLVATDTMLQGPKGSFVDSCVVPNVTFTPGLLIIGSPAIQFLDINGNDPSVTGLPYWDVVQDSGTSYHDATQLGQAVFVIGGTNVTMQRIEAYHGGSDDNANSIRIGLNGAGGANFKMRYVAAHDSQTPINSGGPVGDIVFQDSVCFNSVFAPGGAPSHCFYAAISSTGNCTSITVLNSTLRDSASGSGGHMLKSRCLTTTVTHSYLATLGQSFSSGCDAGLDAFEAPDGGVVLIQNSVLEIGPCNDVFDLTRLDAELLCDAYSCLGTGGKALVSIPDIDTTFTGTLSGGVKQNGTVSPSSPLVTGLSCTSGCTPPLQVGWKIFTTSGGSPFFPFIPTTTAISSIDSASQVTMGASLATSSPGTANFTFGSDVITGISGDDQTTFNNLATNGAFQYAFVGPTAGDVNGQAWAYGANSSIGCQPTNGFVTLLPARVLSVAPGSVVADCADNVNGTQGTAAARNGGFTLRLQTFKPDPTRTHSTTLKDVILINDKVDPAAQSAVNAVFTRSPAGVTLQGAITMVNNPTIGLPFSASTFQSTYFGGNPAPNPNPYVSPSQFPNTMPWSSSAGQVSGSTPTVYASRSAAATAGLFTGVTCTPTNVRCLPNPP